MKRKQKLSMKDRYERYRRDYFKKQEKIQAYGGEMRMGILSEEQFTNAYIRRENYRKDLIERGERSSIGNISEDIINYQAYDPRISFDKATKILEWYFRKNEIDRKPTMMEIQALRVKGASGLLTKFYESKKEEYEKEYPKLSAAERNRMIASDIGEEFFGSIVVA